MFVFFVLTPSSPNQTQHNIFKALGVTPTALWERLQQEPFTIIRQDFERVRRIKSLACHPDRPRLADGQDGFDIVSLNAGCDWVLSLEGWLQDPSRSTLEKRNEFFRVVSAYCAVRGEESQYPNLL